MSALISPPSWGKSKTRLSPIGLHLGSRNLHLVQLSGEPTATPKISAHAILSYPIDRASLLNSPGALRRVVKAALATGGFKGRRVVTALGATDTRLLSVTYQIGVGETDEQAIAKLMADRVDDELDQLVIDYIPVRTDGRGRDRLALVIISERTTVIAHLEALRKAGLEVLALEIAPVAIRRMVSAMIAPRETADATLAINVGEVASHLIVVSGRRLLYEQQVDFGAARLEQVLTETLGLRPDLAADLLSGGRQSAHTLVDEDSGHVDTVTEILRPEFAALTTEIRRAILFATSETRGGQLGQAFVMGRLKAWPWVNGLLAELTGLEVSSLPPFEHADDSRLSADTSSSGSLIAAGLALRGWVEDA